MRAINVGLRWARWLLLTIVLLRSLCEALTSDGEVLLSFKKGIYGSENFLLNWNATDSDPCRWSGVRCGYNSTRVHWLLLPYHHLKGTISPELGKLNELRKLKLHENNFGGSIPAEFGNLFKLKELFLRGNSLSGSIPSSLSQLGDLEYLDISRNYLTGPIPESFGKLSKLRFLNVSANSLAGEIPTSGPLRNLSSSSFAGNTGLCGPQVEEVCEAPSPASAPVYVSPVAAPAFASAPAPERNPCVGTLVPTDGAADVRTHSSLQLRNALLIAITGVLSFFGLSSFWAYYFYKSYNRTHRFAQVKSVVSSKKLVMFHGDLPYASRDVIKKIELLDDTDVIGSGGFGTVYRLVMEDGSWFAVKKIGKCGLSSERLFERELEILGSFKHRNLVNLRGYCNSPSSKLLIYDYLPYGSLDEFLHEREPHEPPLTWTQRLKIAIGAARALAYLHHDCCPRIIHRDIKSSNILLDGNMEPHVSDFGLAKLLDGDDSHVTTVVAGTFGYLAPEYMHSGRATEKGDVYSFGVVMLELLSGRRPTDPSFTEKGLNVVGWVGTHLRENRHKDIFDPKCPGAQKESMENMLQVAMLCIAANPDERPTMEQVVPMLEAETFTPCPSDIEYDSNPEDRHHQSLLDAITATKPELERD